MPQTSKLWGYLFVHPFVVRCAFGVLMTKETYVCKGWEISYENVLIIIADQYFFCRKYIVMLFFQFYRIIPLFRFRYCPSLNHMTQKAVFCTRISSS